VVIEDDDSISYLGYNPFPYIDDVFDDSELQIEWEKVMALNNLNIENQNIIESLISNMSTKYSFVITKLNGVTLQINNNRTLIVSLTYSNESIKLEDMGSLFDNIIFVDSPPIYQYTDQYIALQKVKLLRDTYAMATLNLWKNTLEKCQVIIGNYHTLILRYVEEKNFVEDLLLKHNFDQNTSKTGPYQKRITKTHTANITLKENFMSDLPALLEILDSHN